jgi:tetratricopeptide (TPR) repeat protein
MFSLDQLQLLPPKKWEDLEILVKDLFRAEWRDFHAQRHGRQGQAQQGVDVFGRPLSVPGWAGIQCKNKDLLIRSRLTIDELRQEVKNARAFQPPLAQFIIATTAPRDTRLQEEARKISDRHSRRGGFSVHVYAWDDIVELLAKHKRLAMHYYGNVVRASAGSRQPLLSEETMAAAFGAEATSSVDDPQAATAPLVLPVLAARALGILATCPLPLPEDAYRRLFADIDWRAGLQTLTAAGAIIRDGSRLQVPDGTKQSFLPTPADRLPYVDIWIAKLEPLREHVDMALLLSLQYLARQEQLKAVEVVVDLTEGLEPGTWNDLYASVLGAYSQPRFLTQLSREQRLRFFHAYGLCLARGHWPGDALAWAGRLRRESARTGSHWGLAQSFLLAGIAHQAQGDLERAEEEFLRAATHARRHRLPLLVGHALHNLAMVRSGADPAGAAPLLEESIRFKQRAGDEPGRVGGMIGRGLLAAGQGQLTEAERWFVRAKRLASRLDMRHARAVALCNLAVAVVQQERPSEAVGHYEAAQKLAEHEGLTDTLAFAVAGEALARLAMKRYSRAHDCFVRLHQLRRDMRQEEAAAIALHDAGVCLLKAGNGEKARMTLENALAEARRYGILEWVYRCRKDIALTYSEEAQPERTVAALREGALAEQKERRFAVAAKLWETLATVLAEQSAESSVIEDAFTQAITALEHEQDSVDERLRLFSGLYACRWSSFAFDRALDALREMEHISREGRRREALCRALDQRGTCLQQLGRPVEAMADHRAALAVARRLPDTMLAEHCLSNLGEALRKSGRTKAAIRVFREAEALARARRDHASAILTAHNRALALEDAGRRKEAGRVLRFCQDQARRLGLWHEYVRALHGLANHAWLLSKADAAVRQYRKALTEAKKHGICEQIGPLALNYANALRYQNRPRRALRVLQNAAQHFLRLPDAHDYLVEMGAAAAEARDLEAAKDCYTRAREHALLVDDEADAVLASGALAEILEREGDYSRADDLLREALTHEQPPEEEASLLAQRLRVLLKAGKAQQAGKVFARLREVTESHGLKEHAVDAHMLLGDHEWDTGKSRTEALKAYTVALGLAPELGLEVMVRVGMHTVRRLLSLDADGRLKEIARIGKAVQSWLERQVGPADFSAVAIALWPVRVARRIAGTPRGLRALNPQETTALLREEIFERTASSTGVRVGRAGTRTRARKCR